MERTQEEKLLGGLAHIAVLFSWIGLIFNLVIFFVYKPKSAFVANHAKQALALTILGILVSYILGPIFGVGVGSALMMGSLGGMVGFALIGGLVIFAFWIAVLVVVIMGAIKGFQGQEYQYPLFGEFVAKMNI